MQRMSGIATTTQEYVKLLEGTGTKILDTRKTTPGMRMLEKEAVRLGGGMNHRFGLYDMIMIKDNHIDFAGGIPQAVSTCRDYLKTKKLALDIVVETRSLEDIKTVLSLGGVQRIMLDNFSLDLTREAVNLIDHRMETESSGGITRETIRSYAECGVDYISVGALTHQIQSLDLSLKAEF
jgi:nicotinate-nucleotide pyrophosphorylase (carboxylating)